MSGTSLQFTIKADFLDDPYNTKSLYCIGLKQLDGSFPITGLSIGEQLGSSTTAWSTVDSIIYLRFAITEGELASDAPKQIVELSMQGSGKYPGKAAVNTLGAYLELYESDDAIFTFHIGPTIVPKIGDSDKADWANPRGPFEGIRPEFGNYLIELPESNWPPGRPSKGVPVWGGFGTTDGPPV